MKVEDKIKALELQRADLDSQIEVLKAEATAVWRRLDTDLARENARLQQQIESLEREVVELTLQAKSTAEAAARGKE